MKNLFTVFTVTLCVITFGIYYALLDQWYTIWYIGKGQSDSIISNLTWGSFPAWGLFAAILISLLITKCFIWLYNEINNLFIGILLLGSSLTYQSCGTRAQANQQTLYTESCGVNWRLIKPGETIPYCNVGCHCTYSVRVPDYPMQGSASFKLMFEGNVIAKIEVSYDYVIDSALLFIKEAKYLGKANTESSDATNSSSAYETAENMVIDKRIREVLRELTQKEDVVDFNPDDIEEQAFIKINELLDSRGVTLNFISIVTEFDEQTKLAIDAATAIRVYKSKGLDSAGLEIMKARAGATQITIVNNDKEDK
jgi:hypothetical protein